MIHRIERDLEISKDRRNEKAKEKAEPSSVCAGPGVASSGSGTAQAKYTPHQKPTRSLAQAFYKYRITYPAYPRRFTEELSPTSLPNKHGEDYTNG